MKRRTVLVFTDDDDYADFLVATRSGLRSDLPPEEARAKVLLAIIYQRNELLAKSGQPIE